MPTLRGFVAYPAQPSEIGRVIIAAIDTARTGYGLDGLRAWEQNDVAGRFIVDPILSQIKQSDILVADVTRLNFNVAYEIGFAIGARKRVLLIRYSAFTNDTSLIRDVGIFDTLGWTPYENSADLARQLSEVTSSESLTFDATAINRSAPVYVISPRHRTDSEIHILSRIKKARLNFRTFDPDEQGRMSAPQAIDNVASSYGVVVPLLSSDRADSTVHNFRAAFVAGLADGMEKILLLLQAGYEPVPLDYRDLVRTYINLSQIDPYVADFASELTAAWQAKDRAVLTPRAGQLANLTLGASAAENEMRELSLYYLETDEYRRATRGEVQIVAGRKGSGKTALFSQLRDRLRQNRKIIVLDLMPEGFQLLKFKELILDQLEAGTREHTITAFWEYVLLLEVCHKLLEKDRQPHMKDHTLYQPYKEMAAAYEHDEFVAEGDFAERMLKLTSRISQDFQAAGASAPIERLSNERLTELLYKHDLARLRSRVHDYLTKKAGLWILFDNLDKGWPPHGIQPHDLLLLRCLLDALAKLDRSLNKRGIQCHGIVFIRNDVYELLLDAVPDRGKLVRVNIDWTDGDLLREVLRRRMAQVDTRGGLSFEQLWSQICVSHVAGEESSQYLIDRCLMRPRNLIDLVSLCRSHAVNLRKERIDEEDIRRGEESYSTDLITNISFEIRDVYPGADDVLYGLIEAPARLTRDELDRLLGSTRSEPDRERLLDFLLWYGVLGLVRQNGEVAYIYDVGYDSKRLKALLGHRDEAAKSFAINPAFWAGLEVKR